MALRCQDGGRGSSVRGTVLSLVLGHRTYVCQGHLLIFFKLTLGLLQVVLIDNSYLYGI